MANYIISSRNNRLKADEVAMAILNACGNASQIKKTENGVFTVSLSHEQAKNLLAKGLSVKLCLSQTQN